LYGLNNGSVPSLLASFFKKFLFSFNHFHFRMPNMNSLTRNGGVCRIGFLAVLFFSIVSLKANPIAVEEEPVLRLATLIPLTLAILVEAICVRVLLRRWRRPTAFILLLMLMHVPTYPLFLGILWLSYSLHPALSVAIGEALIVLIEGGLIYLICRHLASAKSELPVPSLARSVFASLIGNIFSAATFPFLIMLYGLIGRSMVSLG
jgi:hypothetical protein